MNIKSRLAIVMAVPLGTLVALVLLAWFQFGLVARKSRPVYDTHIPSLVAVVGINTRFDELQMDVQQHVLATDPARMTIARTRFEADAAELEKQFKAYESGTPLDSETRKQTREVRTLMQAWVDKATQAVAMSGQGDPENKNSALAMIGESGELEALRQKVAAGSQEWARAMNDRASRAGDDALDAGTAARVQFTLFALAAIVGTAVLGIGTGLRVLRPIQAMQGSVKSIAAGNFDTAVAHTKASDELGDLARAIEVLRQSAAATEDQGWCKAGVATITADIQHATTFEDLGKRTLAGIASRIGDGVGRFYLLAGATRQLVPTAAHGIDARVEGKPHKLGEGIVGRAARDRQPVFYNDSAGGEYVRVGTSLGGSTRPHAVAWPILARDEVVGVLEVWTKRALKSRERELFGELGPLVGLSMEIIARNVRLLQTEQWYRSILQSAPDGMIVLEQDGKVTLANQRMRDLLGYSAEELVGANVGILFASRDRARNVELVQRFFKNPVAGTLGEVGTRFSCAHKDGRSIPFEITLAPLPSPGGGPPTAAAAFRDATIRMQAEATLKRARDIAEDATKMKSNFLANMSHEIPHADERDHRAQPPGAQECQGTSPEGLHREGARVGEAAPRHHQRHPRLLEGRGRQARARGGRLRSRRGPHQRRDDGVHARAREGPRAPLRHRPPDPDATRRRSAAARPDPPEPRRQRGEVHRGGRGRGADAPRGDRRGPGADALRGARHGHRHVEGADRSTVPVVQPGRPLDDAEVRRHGARSRDQPAARRPHGRSHHVESEPGEGTTFRFVAVLATGAPEEEDTQPPAKDLRGAHVLVVDDAPSARTSSRRSSNRSPVG